MLVSVVFLDLISHSSSLSPDIIVATPGRLLHVMVETKISFSRVSMVVFDEADTMFEKALETDITLRVMEAFRAEGIRPPEMLHRAVEVGSVSGAGLVTAG